MSGFIDWLEKLNEKDSKVRAELRRSLSFEPGCYPSAYPYVEPFVKGEDNSWRREMHYLVAGLWAMHWRAGLSGAPTTIAKAGADYMVARGATNTERRFIALLDADRDQLPYRLRQMVSLLKEYTIDFDALLGGLLYWNNDQKSTQNRWARDFYRNIVSDVATPNNILEEDKNENPD